MKGTVAVIALGCAKNLVDAEAAVGALVADGYRLTFKTEAADVVLVYTCGFIGEARREAEATLAGLADRLKEDATLAVVGCWPQWDAGLAARRFPRADVVLGVSPPAEVVAAIRTARAGGRVIDFHAPAPPLDGIADRPSLTARHVSFLKIADGCDHPCSFCIIPRLRGPFRSRPFDDVVREAEAAAARGVAELILIAQDTSRYGEDLPGRVNLAKLLRRLGGMGIPWIRVMYLHPARVTEELLAAFAEVPALVKYLDIPLQHAAPDLLAAMGRPAVEPDKMLDWLEGVRRAIPGVAFRTSFIVGFPGETQGHFRQLRDFVTAARFDHVGVFEFSAEEGAPAAKLRPRPCKATARRRRERLMFTQQQVLAEKYENIRGAETEVLIDRQSRGERSFGRAYFQAPDEDTVTVVEGVPDGAAGTFARVRFMGNVGYDLVAEYLGSC